MSPTSPKIDSTLYLFMTSSHDRLRERLIRLLEAMAANARDDIATLWNELDNGLLTHMEAEERFVLPQFAHIDRAEARELLRQHGEIREQLLELGIAIDLHYVRFERAEDFVRLLQSHAAREERLLYRWADERLTPETIEAVRARIAAESEV